MRKCQTTAQPSPVQSRSFQISPDQSTHLRDLRVAREAVRVLEDRRRRRADLEDGAPLGEARALLVVALAALAEAVEALFVGLWC